MGKALQGKTMKWGKAYGTDRQGNQYLVPEAIQSHEGYRCLRQKVSPAKYKYSAWQPAPELQSPHLKLLSVHDDPEAAKKACETHYTQLQLRKMA